MAHYKVLDGLIGLAVGDALGVPVEFQTRRDLRRDPVRSMRGYGTHNQAPGTWSDDTAMALCLVDGLCDGYDPQKIAQNFVRWYAEGFWRPTPTMKDIGTTTRQAIWNLQRGIPHTESGIADDSAQSNGSLMRTLPLAFLLEKSPNTEKFPKIEEVSGITHAHPVCKIACSIYVQTAIHLLQGHTPRLAYDLSRGVIASHYGGSPHARHMREFDRILDGALPDLAEKEIHTGSGAVITLEASLWNLLKNKDYPSTVLAAVNLGADTDTTGAVAGGLAGIAYGRQSAENPLGIPARWVDQLARKDEILDLCGRFSDSLGK